MGYFIEILNDFSKELRYNFGKLLFHTTYILQNTELEKSKNLLGLFQNRTRNDKFWTSTTQAVKAPLMVLDADREVKAECPFK